MKKNIWALGWEGPGIGGKQTGKDNRRRKPVLMLEQGQEGRTFTLQRGKLGGEKKGKCKLNVRTELQSRNKGLKKINYFKLPGRTGKEEPELRGLGGREGMWRGRGKGKKRQRGRVWLGQTGGGGTNETL